MSRATRAARAFDIIYDIVRGKLLDATFASIRRFGHVVSELAWRGSRLVEAGQLMPLVGPRRFTLETVDEAYALIPG